MKRSEERKWIIKLIFQNEFNEIDISKIEDIIRNHDIEPTIFMVDSIISILKNEEYIDQLINSKLNKGTISSLQPIELVILRVSINEFYIQKSVPVSVSINEAVNNIKEFSIGNSHKLINGILSSIAKEIK